MRYEVGVLGATGLVGQRFVALLAKHPWFKLRLVTASSKHVGKRYGETVNWVIDTPLPSNVRDLEIKPTDPEVITKEQPDIIFSALPPDIALDIELKLVRKGFKMVSNASPLRMEPDIPLLNPEVNADHIVLINHQRKIREWDGFIVKVPNCSTAILTLALKPILDEFGLRSVIVSTMQALSGAGYAGVPSVAILDNIIPYIPKEGEKLESETLKILGSVKSGGIKYADIRVSASCHRVMVLDGHLEAVFAETLRKVSVEEVKEVLKEFKGNKVRGLGLPSAPDNPIIVRDEPDRPQPRLDRMSGGGMSIVVGRIREDRVFNGIKFLVLGHNTIRGAAGTAVLIAELLVREGYV